MEETRKEDTKPSSHQILDIPVHGFKEAPDQPVAPKRKYWRDPNDPAPAEPVRWVRPKRRTYPELAEAEDLHGEFPAKRARVEGV